MYCPRTTVRCLAGLVLMHAAISPQNAAGQNPGLPGPYRPGSARVTVTRPNATTFTARFYYPATVSGTNTPFDPSGGPYPMISFGHGFLQDPSRYFGTLEHLATHGFLVIANESETGPFPSHTNMANDMRHGVTYLENRGRTPGDPLHQRVWEGNAGMSGHSMGAGAALLAAAADPRVKGVANLATAITNPSPLPLLPNFTIPLSFLSGDQDTIVPIGSGTLPAYGAAPSPKLQPTIVGGSHCGFQDIPYPLFCDQGTLPAAQQLAITREYLTSFFRLHLKRDQTQWRNIWGPEAFGKPGLPTQADPGITLTTNVAEQWVRPGKQITFDVTLTNTGTTPDQYELYLEDHLWSSSLSHTVTPTLSSGSSFQFGVTVTAPLSTSVSAMERVLVSARSLADGGTRDYLSLTSRLRGTTSIETMQLARGNLGPGPVPEPTGFWGTVCMMAMLATCRSRQH